MGRLLGVDEWMDIDSICIAAFSFFWTYIHTDPGWIVLFLLPIYNSFISFPLLYIDIYTIHIFTLHFYFLAGWLTAYVYNLLFLLGSDRSPLIRFISSSPIPAQPQRSHPILVLPQITDSLHCLSSKSPFRALSVSTSPRPCS